ncbi:hypothetical protein BHE74_00017416 [Ensete ventricosum]|uniref:Neprosin PEP catalytic domain-containing protein n=1 Tax=Ensete ventricosum TaxID=4639 RepID=A0A444D7L9_ENSVE|nr:hypothetical protein B296_00014142 [Ensete ventricosum]RWV94062.1 hypothetical protein GW17_00043434 [Ensete ventricosum]RWW74626.1 hypothetical protein BHE74_00017416 [Ensete ventricosum]RZS01658.1 hypothetical protein BHM03_00031554 [Ensete ventricosum]
MRPAFHPEGLLFDESKVASQKKTPSMAQLWHQNGRCSEGTIPIRRTKRDDVLRASSVKRYGKKKHRSIPNPLSIDPDLLNESGHQLIGTHAPLVITRVELLDQDPKEGHWWMQFGNDYVLGYWPSFLFSYLADSASMVEWGGEVVNSEPDGEHTSTAMGSGHFPEEGFGRASYFRNIQIVDESNNLKAPRGVGTFTEQSNCYDVQTGNSNHWGHFFYYGGPGRNSNCP